MTERCIPERPGRVAEGGGMAINRPPRRPLFALVDAVLRHPGATLVVTIALWLLERLLGS